MSEPYVGEIRIVSFDYAPDGWAFCEGQLLSPSDYSALSYLLGTLYGGDGINTFALPDMRGRVPVHIGQGPGLSSYVQGAAGGEATHTLTTTEIPAHTHSLIAVTDAATTNDPTGNYLAQASGSLGNVYGAATNPVNMSSQALSMTGDQPHNNLQQYLPLNFIIALYGVYPSAS